MPTANSRAAVFWEWFDRRFRQLVIGLGWTGCCLVLIGWLGHLLPLELTDKAVRNWVYGGATVLLLLWPRALYLQFWPRLRGWQRWAAGTLTALLAVPFAWLILFRVVVGPDQPMFEKVLVNHSDGAYITEQTVCITRENWRRRLVQVRPLGLGWQLVADADTNALPLHEQRHMRWLQQRIRQHRRH